MYQVLMPACLFTADADLRRALVAQGSSIMHWPSGTEVIRAFNVSSLAQLVDGEIQADAESHYWSSLNRILAILYAVYLVLAVIDLKRVYQLVWSDNPEAEAQKLVVGSPSPSAASSMVSGHSPSASPSLGSGGTWSVFSVSCLLAYRLYTGFNTATWLPYLLAREGEELWFDDQAAFMGVAKLIYGGTMLLNPLMGLFGDYLVLHSHGLGRRFFLRIGVLMAASGIMICMLSDAQHNFYWFMFGILTWRLGECMNDVTMEALAPEMVPVSQYSMASAVKGGLFLMGGVLGYVMLMFSVHVRFTWLYSAYLAFMLICSMPALFILRESVTMRESSNIRRLQSKTSFDYLTHAYLAPARLPGGFSLACLSVFVFALGTAPMFFLLLMVRDLVGIKNQVLQQREFSYLSVTFFLFSVVAAVFSSADGSQHPARDGRVHHNKDEPGLYGRARKLIIAVAAFGLLAIAIPFMTFFHAVQIRMLYFFVIAIFFGFCFGAAYVRFQDLTWVLVPESSDWANTMGFNVMCRNAGIGLGNFLAGIILNLFAMQGYTEVVSVTPEKMQIEHQAAYAPSGYYVMCGASGVAVLISALLASQAVDMHPDDPGAMQPLNGFKGPVTSGP
ncbi:unnamed protein product [Effrenium voratum]|nr:unnamed protein product [Effrenium voratum]